MDKKLKILQVSPEVGPFARTGGLADVVWALSKELKALGHDVQHQGIFPLDVFDVVKWY